MSEFSTVVSETPIESAWANAIIDHAFEKPCSFIVRKNGSNYEAIYGSASNQAGKIFGTPSTNAAAVIQAAIDGLTAGRDYKEVIFLKGIFDINSTVTVKNYTILNCKEAKFNAGASLGANDAFILQNNVEIRGGYFIDNPALQVVRNGLYLSGNQIIVDSAYLYGYDVNIVVIGDDAWLLNNYLNNPWDSNIITGTGADRTRIINNRLENNESQVGGANLSITGNHCWLNLNRFYNSGGHNVTISSDNNIIIQNIFDTSPSATLLRFYIFFGKTEYNIVYLNQFINGSIGIEEVSGKADNNNFEHNTFTSVTTPIVKDGANTKAKFNSGFVTENGSTATISNGTTEVTVTHGCNYTPAAEDINVHPIETLNNASFWWVDTITSTTFKIKVNADPGQDVDFKWNVLRV